MLPRLDFATRKGAWFGALDNGGVSIQLDTIERAALPQWIAQRLQQQGQHVAPGEEVGGQPHRHPADLPLIGDHPPPGHVGETHQHAAMAVVHAVGMVLLDAKRHGLVVRGLVPFRIERADRAAEAALPEVDHIAVGNDGGLDFGQIIGHRPMQMNGRLKNGKRRYAPALMRPRRPAVRPTASLGRSPAADAP